MIRLFTVSSLLVAAVGGCAHLQEKGITQDMHLVRPGALSQDRVKGYFLKGSAPGGGLYRNITSAPDAVSAELWSAYPPMGQRLATVRVALGRPGGGHPGFHYEPETTGAEQHVDSIRRGLEAHLAE